MCSYNIKETRTAEICKIQLALTHLIKPKRASDYNNVIAQTYNTLCQCARACYLTVLCGGQFQQCYVDPSLYIAHWSVGVVGVYS